MDITKEIWKGRKQEMEKLIKHVKEIGFFDGIKKKKIICRKKSYALDSADRKTKKSQ
jgi:hypothetical protein